MKKAGMFIIIIFIVMATLAYFSPEFRSLIKEFSGGTKSSAKVYKWKDKENNWQITDTPPPDGIEYKELEYLSNTNVMPALKEKEK